MAKGPERLVRWIMGHTQPVPYSLDIEHPAMDDIAWAADEIERLQAELRAAKLHMDRYRSALERISRIHNADSWSRETAREALSDE